ncbi:CAP-GLY domain-containing linker protein 1 [Halocaridina rubra]|uniref:CAP-GLY domain-containing linker protein 1 n=1 Tax=Halocaridina rubra TaxID=373956 RepID=A0AAN8X769_HALRR
MRRVHYVTERAIASVNSVTPPVTLFPLREKVDCGKQKETRRQTDKNRLIERYTEKGSISPKTMLRKGCNLIPINTDVATIGVVVIVNNHTKASAIVVKELLRDGADVHQRCRWTHMTALHYAAYFDVAPVLDLLLCDPKGVCINDACLEYSGGAPLHIAAANLCLDATKVLLKHGALLNLTDTQGRTPFQCIPTPDQYELVPDVQNVIAQLRSLLSPSSSHCYSNAYDYSSHPTQGFSGRAVLKAMGLKLGDRVLVSGVKTGTLSVCMSERDCHVFHLKYSIWESNDCFMR